MKLDDKKIVALIFVFVPLLFVLQLLTSEDLYGGGDAYQHFSIAKYSWKHPKLFLDHWGKPVFTLLYSPFAQLGVLAAQTFSIILTLSAAFITYLISKKLKYNYAWLAILLTCFAPIYFISSYTCLTETLFSFILIASIYLLLEEKYFYGAILISFLPMVRNEAVVILPFFAFFFLLNKKTKNILALATGTIIYSLIGFGYYGDILWLIHQNPYSGAKDIYGSGPLLHFVMNYTEIFGYTFSILLVIGTITIALKSIRKIKTEGIHLLILGSFYAYFLLHSFLWWKGMGSSLGLTRVIAAVIPVASLIAMGGLNYIVAVMKEKIWAHRLILSITIVTLCFYPFYLLPLPVELSPTGKVVKQASEWAAQNKKAEGKIYCYDPLFIHFMNLDPYDSEKVFIPYDPQVLKSLKDGDYVFWDAHFGTNEGRTPLDSLLANPYLKMLTVLRPNIPFKVLGNNNYEFVVFEKTTTPQKREKSSMVITKIDFENDSLLSSDLLPGEFANSGTHSMLLNEKTEYSKNIEMIAKDVLSSEVSSVIASVYFYPTEKINEGDALFVFTIENNGKAYVYETNNVIPDNYKIGEWNELTIKIASPPNSMAEDKLKIYFWNKGRKKILIDDLQLSVEKIYF